MEEQEGKEQKEQEQLLKKVEAALFLAARWLSLDELVRLTSINPLMLREALDKLKQYYDGSKSSITILRSVVDGIETWKMDIQQEHAYLINRLATGKTEFTKSEQATLAIIAYKQPIKQSVIVRIRGNKAYEHVKHFIRVGLVRAKKAGRTLELNASESFYDYFNLKERSIKTNKNEE